MSDFLSRLAKGLTDVLAAAAPETAQRTVDYPALGVRFDVPAGWSGQEGEGRYVLQNLLGIGMVALLPHDAASLDELREDARDGIDAEGGTSLRPNGPVEPFQSEGLRLDMTGTVEWSPVEAHAIGRVSPHGGGVVVVSVAPFRRLTDAYRAHAEAVAQSVVFSAPEAPAIARQWASELRGVRLAHYVTRTGIDDSFSSKQTLTLCDGVFWYGSSYSGYGNNRDASGEVGSSVSLAGSERKTGTWEVVSGAAGQPVLRLTYEGGSVEEYALSYEDGMTYLDGDRVLRTEADCR